MRRTIALLSALAVSFLSAGQTRYASTELEQIAALLEQKPHSCIMESARNGMVTHIGLPLFPRSMGDRNYDMVARFVERYALKALLLPEDRRDRMMREDRVVMDVAATSRQDSTRNVSITEVDGTFRVSWPECSVILPKSFGLISGMDMSESDAWFVEDLKNYVISNGKDYQAAAIETRAPEDSMSYYVEKGEKYLIDAMNDNRYYVRDSDGSLHPIYSVDFVSESVSNLLLSLVKGDFTLDVTQNMYGFKTVSYSLPLVLMNSYCGDRGCHSFVGIESESDTEVSAVVVYRNEFFSYNHLLCLSIPKESLARQKGTVKASMYCNIPTHNLTSLFGEL